MAKPEFIQCMSCGYQQPYESLEPTAIETLQKLACLDGLAAHPAARRSHSRG